MFVKFKPFLLILAASLLLAACNATGQSGGNLEGQLWEVQSYLNNQGEMVAPLPDTSLTSLFQEGTVNGSAGCNNYFGSYTLDGAKITFGPLGSTQMFCEPAEKMQQEGDFLAALQQVASFKVGAEKLELMDQAGKVVLVYQPAVSASLVGTNWLLVNYNNGQEAVVGVLADTELTALFAEDGSLSGSAGCNNFTTSYKTDGNKIEIGLPASTMMMCAEPEGVMEQEAAYLAALAKAATYEIRQNQLEFRGANDELIALYNVAP